MAMNMKTRILYLAAAAALLLTGCNKTSVIQGSDPVYGEGKPLQFKVSIDGFATRSHFEDEGQGAVGDKIKLVWDEGDAIGVVAVPYDETTGKYRFDLVADEAHVCIAAYSGVDGNGKATFTSTEDNLTWWMAKGEEEGDDYTSDESLYGFFAYYPAHIGEKHPFEFRGENVTVGFFDNYLIDKIYTPKFNIPATQDGVNFNNYHLLYDLTHLPMLDIEDHKAEAFITAASLKEGTPINFPGFQPVTSMLRFSMQSKDDNSYSVSKVKATIRRFRYFDDDVSIPVENPQTGTVWENLYYNYSHYYLPFFGIAGDAISPTAFHPGLHERIREDMEYDDGKGDDEDDDEPEYIELNYKRLLATALVSGESDLMPPFTGFIKDGIHTSNSITIYFKDPVTVSSSPSQNYYMVLLPTFLQIFESGITGVVSFEAMDGNDNVLLNGELRLPKNGIEAGHRYNFTLTLGEGVTYDGNTAGSYQVIPVVTE